MHKKYHHRNSFLIDFLSTMLIIAGLFVLGYVLLHLLYWIFLTTVGILLLFVGAKIRKHNYFSRWFSRFH